MAEETQDQKIARLEKEKTELQKKHDALQKASDKLLADQSKASGEQNAALQKKYDELVASADKDKSELEKKFQDLVTSSAQEITALGQRLSKAEATAEEVSPTITVEKKKYKVIGKGFRYNSSDYTVEDLKKDKSLQKELVEKGVGFLVEITD